MIISFSKAKKLKKLFPNKKIAISGGVFDLLHEGHIDYLEAITKPDQILTIIIPTDNIVRSRKGKNRPIFNQKVRARIISKIKGIDFVLLGEEKYQSYSSPLTELVAKIMPDIFYLGSDALQRLRIDIGKLKKLGIKVVPIKIKKINSTTRLVKKLGL